MSLLVACEPDPVVAPTPTPEAIALLAPDPNTKTILFEDDLDADPTLVMGVDDLVIAYVYTEKPTNRTIPFTIPQAGGYDLCLSQADNVLHAKIIDELGAELISFAPSYSLECKNVDLNAQQYDLVLSNGPRFNSIFYYDDDVSARKTPSVSYIRDNEKIQIRSDVTEENWNSGLNIIKLSLGFSQNVKDRNNISHRRCYTVPVSVRSPVAFRQDGDKLMVSFRADYSDGEKKNCTYVEADSNNPPAPTSAGDIGDIDTIISSFVESDRALTYSRPRKGDTNISVGSDIVIGFDGVLDRLTKDQAFTISPAVNGVKELYQGVFTFNPTGALKYDTKYIVTLSGLSDADGNPAVDISYSFRTGKQFNISGIETVLSNDELCALGVSEYCQQKQYSTLTSLDVNILNSTSAGSRYLEVRTVLDSASDTDTVFEYSIYTETDSVVASGGFVLEAGNVSDTGLIELKESDFDKTIKSVVLKIEAHNVFNQLNHYRWTWGAYNGELFQSTGSVVTNDSYDVRVQPLSFLSGITEHDRKLKLTLSEPATEEVSLKIHIDAVRTLLSGITTNLSYDYPDVVTFDVGVQQVTIDVRYPCIYSTCNYPPNYQTELLATVIDARNVDILSVFPVNETVVNILSENIPVALNSSLNVNEDLLVSGMLLATDPNQLPVTFSIVNQPVNGILVLNNADTGLYSYVVDSLNCDVTCTSDSFTFKVNNGFSDSVEATVSININRDASVPTPVDSVIDVTEDIGSSSILSANTVSGLTNTFSLVSQGAKGSVVITDAQAGNYTYTPNANETGSDSFTFTVVNSNGGSPVTAQVLVNVLPQDDVTVAQDINIVIDEGTVYESALPVIELDGDKLTLITVTPSSLGRFNYYSTTGKVRYSPNYSDTNGVDTFSYKVNDGTSDSNIATVTVTINPVNNAPETSSSSLSSVVAGGSRSGVLNGIDWDGDPLIFSIVTQPSLGSVAITNVVTGDVTYTANANIDIFSRDSFTYKVSDGLLDSTPRTVEVVIYPDTVTPTVFDRSYTIDENGVLGRNFSAMLYAGYSSATTYQVVSQSQNGELNHVDGSDRFTYIPRTNFIGSDSFTYTATENGMVSNIATITINVVDVEFTPEVSFSEKRIATGESVSDVLTATDGDGDAITYSVVAQPSSGTVLLDSLTGAYTYTSTATTPVSDYFIWAATDSKGNAANAMVYFTVFDAANTVPTVSGLAINDLNGGDVVANDVLLATYNYVDAEGDPESNTRIRWLLDGVVITNQSLPYYTVLSTDVGSLISFDILPAAESGRELGDLVESNAVSVISPDVFLSMGFGIKQLKFSWQDTTSAAYYKLFENPDNASGFTQIGADILGLNTDVEISVHLHDWDNARYLLQACDFLDVCTDSNELSTFSIDSSNDEKTTGYFKASNTGDGDQFGSAVAISADGNTMVIGALGESNFSGGINGDQTNIGDSSYGAAYVFNKVNGVWSQQAYLKAPVPKSSGRFGTSVAISANGDTIAIGGGLSNEDVHVYQRVSDSWSHQILLNAANTNIGDDFGISLAMSADGKTLVIGAPDESSSATTINGDPNNDDSYGSGAAYIFKEVTGTWSQQTYIKASNADSSDAFGSTVSISADGKTVAVGALREDSSSTGINGADPTNNDTIHSGAVYVYVENIGVWSQQAYIKASNTNPSDYLGQSLALNSNGDRLVAGVTGAVYVFDRNINDWSQQAYINEAGGQAVSLSADGNMLMIGSGYLLTYTNSQWQHERIIKTSLNEVFGNGASAISADGSSLVMSKSREQSAATGINGDQTDKSISNAGAVYLY